MGGLVSQPVTAVDKIIKGRIDADEPVEKMGNDVQYLALIPLRYFGQVALRRKAGIAKFLDKAIEYSVVFVQSLFQHQGKSVILC